MTDGERVSGSGNEKQRGPDVVEMKGGRVADVVLRPLRRRGAQGHLLLHPLLTDGIVQCAAPHEDHVGDAVDDNART